MSKVFHGGYRLIDLGGVDIASAGSGVVVAGIYDACVGLELKKRVVLTNFLVSGALKNEVEAQLSKSGDDFVITGIYGYDLTIKKSDGKVYSVTSITGILSDLGQYVVKITDVTGVSPNDISGNVLDSIVKGTFIDTNFAGLVSPIFLPAVYYPQYDQYRGAYISNESIGFYKMESTGTAGHYGFSLNTVFIEWGLLTHRASIRNIEQFNEKNVPAYPSDTEHNFTLKLVAGTLTWVQDA